jgi:hypothetical protein
MFKKVNNLNLKRPEHVLYCRIRNEDYFIRHFLPHYRALGVEHFYFADDQSNDGTREYLLEQPDCTVIEAPFRFYEEIDGVMGKTLALRVPPEEVIGPGWILSVDADEFLVLPEGYSTIADVVRELEARKQISCVASMVDFYPATLAGRFAERTLNPFEAFPFFDMGPYFVWPQGHVHPLLLYAGVRHRMNEWMFERDGAKVWGTYRPTMLHKVPLIKWGQGLHTQTNHSTNEPPYTGFQLALAHFKFYPDLDAKIEEGLESKFYHAGSYYYHVLKRYLPIFANRPLRGLVSRRFNGPESLTKARLLFDKKIF